VGQKNSKGKIVNIKSLFAVSAIALASVGAQASTVPASDNLIKNGSFEANVLKAGRSSILEDSQLTSWVAGEHGVELSNAVSLAQDVKQFVKLDSGDNGSISQSVAITSAGSYLLSFWFNSQPIVSKNNVPKSTETIKWSFAGKNGKVLTDYATDNSSTWTNFTQIFTFDSVPKKPLTLTFSALGNPDGRGGLIDNVSLTQVLAAPVPEPESYAMLLAGLALMATIARRRKQRQA
jgi:hypothetical protein